MSGYPLNNTNYNWERRPKKCKGGSGGSETFDAKKFGDDLMKYIYTTLPSSTVFPDMYCVVDLPNTFLSPPESDVEFAAISSGAIPGSIILPLYLNAPSSDKTIIGFQDGVMEPMVVGNAFTTQEEVDGTMYYIFIEPISPDG